MKIGALTVCLLIALFLLQPIPIARANAQEAYDALVDALEEMEEAATAVEEKQIEIKEHDDALMRRSRGQDIWELDREYAKEWYARQGELAGELAEANTALQEKTRLVDNARSAFTEAMKPVTDLRREAIKMHRDIGAAGKDPSNTRRAQGAILIGLNKLNGSLMNTSLDMLDAIQQAVAAGRGLEYIKDRLSNMADTEAEKTIADKFIGVAAEALAEAAPDRLQKLEGLLGHGTTAIKTYRVLRGGTREAFGNENFERLINGMDLLSDVLPASLVPVSFYAAAQKVMIQDIYSSFQALSAAEAKNNLTALVVHATTHDDRIRGDLWDRVNPNFLFGEIPPEYSITTNKTEYRPGEEIRVSYETSWRLQDKGWIGLIPWNVAHGSETENDKHDVEHFTTADTNGSMTFHAPERTGTWTLRMFDMDTSPLEPGSDGKELFSITFDVLPESPARLTLAKRSFLPGETIELGYTCPESYGSTAWIGMLPANIEHGDEEVNDQHDIAFFTIVNKPTGTPKFGAPSDPGQYDFRIHDKHGDGAETFFITFTVERMPIGIHIEKTTFKKGETILVRYGVRDGLADNAWIGILPSNIEHGKESVNDEHDVTYFHLRGKRSGYYNLQAPDKAGRWDLRLHDTDDGATGRELDFISFTVEE